MTCWPNAIYSFAIYVMAFLTIGGWRGYRWWKWNRSWPDHCDNNRRSKWEAKAGDTLISIFATLMHILLPDSRCSISISETFVWSMDWEFICSRELLLVEFCTMTPFMGIYSIIFPDGWVLRLKAILWDVCTTAFIPQNIGWPSNDNTNTPTVLQKVSYMAERVVGTGSFGVVYQVC